MARRNARRTSVVKPPKEESPASDPVAAELAALNAAPFGGKGDHDGDGKVGGAHPPIAEPVAEPVRVSAAEPVAPLREKTLAELNAEAWASDAAVAKMREDALAAHLKYVAPLLEGVPVRRDRHRRTQKPLRIPVVK